MARTPEAILQQAMGARLQAIREVLGYSQVQFAEVAGVGLTTISGWETGRNRIDLVKLAKLSERFKFTTDWVATGDLSGMRFDLATKLQARLRASIGAPPAGLGRPKLGRPYMDDPPTVAEAEEPLPPNAPRVVHEDQVPFGGPTKYT